MSISIIGPTFEDLAVNVKKNISNISYIFVGRSAGYIGGSLLGGALFDCMHPHFLLGNSTLTVGVRCKLHSRSGIQIFQKLFCDRNITVLFYGWSGCYNSVIKGVSVFQYINNVCILP